MRKIVYTLLLILFIVLGVELLGVFLPSEKVILNILGVLWVAAIFTVVIFTLNKMKDDSI